MHAGETPWPVAARSLLAVLLPLGLLLPGLPAIPWPTLAPLGEGPLLAPASDEPAAWVPTASEVAASDAPVVVPPFLPEEPTPSGLDLTPLLAASFGRIGAQTGRAMADAVIAAGA